MRKLSTVERHVVSTVDKGSCRSFLLKDRGPHTEDELNTAIDGLISDGTLTASTKSDWIVVTEWLPNTAERMRNGEK